MQIGNKNRQAIVSCVLLLAAAGGAQQQHPEHTWDYGEAHGPTHWGELKPEFTPCKNGHHQSPIDIRNPQKADLPPIEFDYKPSPLDIIDNGHTIMINYAPGSFISFASPRNLTCRSGANLLEPSKALYDQPAAVGAEAQPTCEIGTAITKHSWISHHARTTPALIDVQRL